MQRGSSPRLKFSVAAKRLCLRPGDTPELLVSSLDIIEKFEDDELPGEVLSKAQDSVPHGPLARDQLAVLDTPPSILSDFDMADLSISIQTPSVQFSNAISYETEEDQGAVLASMKRSKYTFYDHDV